MTPTPEVYVDQRRDEVLVRFDFCGPVHALTRDGASVAASRPLFDDELVWTPELSIDTEDAVEKALDEAHSVHRDEIEQAEEVSEERGREKGLEEAKHQVLEAIETVLSRGEVTALLHPGLEHARDALRDELVFQFTEVLTS